MSSMEQIVSHKNVFLTLIHILKPTERMDLDFEEPFKKSDPKQLSLKVKASVSIKDIFINV